MLGSHNYFDHKDLQGNYYYDLLEKNGYQSAGGGGECIAAGSETAFGAWTQWMNSPPHKNILLGLDLSLNDKTKFDYGIGHAYVPGSKWGHYWVVIIASPKESSNYDFFSSDITTSQNTIQSSSGNICSGTTTNHPNVIRKADGKLHPACGYIWASSDSTDYRVKLMTGLTRTSDGKLRPADGYTWVSKDPKDFRVKLIE